MLLLVDSCLDDGRVVGVWDQADHESVLADLCLQGLGIVDIERDWVGVRETLRELLCRFESSAGCGGVISVRHSYTIGLNATYRR